MEWMLVKTIFSLLAVLALMASIVFVLKKYVYKGQAPNASVVGVDVLGYRMLAPKRSVHVIKVLNKIIVVGVTEGGMTSLGEIDDEVLLREIGERMEDRAKTQHNFSDYVEKYMRTFSWNGSKGNGKSGGVHLG
jgi:flagellar biogenesis protein FliO